MEETLKSLKREFEKERKKSTKELEKVAAQLARKTSVWQAHRDELLRKANSANDKLVSEKHNSRLLVQQEFDRAAGQEAKLRSRIAELEQQTFDLTESTKTAKKAEQIYRRKFIIQKRIAAKRLKMKKDLKLKNDELTEQIVDLEKQKAAQDAVIERYTQLLQVEQAKHKKMKKYRKPGKRGGANVWEDWVVLLVVELLVLGVPPKAIPGSIMTVYTTLYGSRPDEVPSVDFVRRCRSVVQVVGETLAAWRLAESVDWRQIFTDATSRRQCAFQALIVGLMTEDGSLDPVIVSSCIPLEDESAQTTFDSVVEKVSRMFV